MYFIKTYIIYISRKRKLNLIQVDRVWLEWEMILELFN